MNVFYSTIRTVTLSLCAINKFFLNTSDIETPIYGLWQHTRKVLPFTVFLFKFDHAKNKISQFSHVFTSQINYSETPEFNVFFHPLISSEMKLIRSFSAVALLYRRCTQKRVRADMQLTLTL
jgi:hypothetical protein